MGRLSNPVELAVEEKNYKLLLLASLWLQACNGFVLVLQVFDPFSLFLKRNSRTSLSMNEMTKITSLLCEIAAESHILLAGTVENHLRC